MSKCTLEVWDSGQWCTVNRGESASALEKMRERWEWSGLFPASSKWRILDGWGQPHRDSPRVAQHLAAPITGRQSQVEGSIWKGWRSPGASFRFGAQGRS